MDILIKNMEMPKNYPYRITIHSDGHVEEHSRYSGHGYYRAIPVPEHGELKDYNDILKIFDKVLPNVDDATNELLCDLLVQIMYAPTVIPSSDSAVVLERTT